MKMILIVIVGSVITALAWPTLEKASKRFDGPLSEDAKKTADERPFGIRLVFGVMLFVMVIAPLIGALLRGCAPVGSDYEMEVPIGVGR